MPTELALTLTATEDERLEQAEAVVRGYCGWHIATSRDETVSVRSTGGVIVLPSLYVTAVGSVTLYDDTIVDAADYEWSEAGVISRLWCGEWSGGRPVSVAFTHGYADIPPEVTGVVQSIAQRGVDNPSSLVRVQKGPFADTYSQTGFNQSLPIALLDAEKEILDRYKLPPRP